MAEMLAAGKASEMIRHLQDGACCDPRGSLGKQVYGHNRCLEGARTLLRFCIHDIVERALSASECGFLHASLPPHPQSASVT